MFGIQFYPTPPNLVERMMSKVDLNKVSYVLEPSAGKGDIIDGFRKYIKDRTKSYNLRQKTKGKRAETEFFKTEDECISYVNAKFGTEFTTIKEFNKYFCDLADKNDDEEIECCIDSYDSDLANKVFEIEAVEIDTSLQAILKDKKIKIVGNDFAEYNPCCRYDLIMMNPPFKDGDKHLLKALKLIENGGQCVCILNAETLKNPYSDSRIYLANLLEKYEADIEYIENAFSDAENTTDVEIALVYVDIPTKEIELDVFKNLVMGEEYKCDYEDYNDTQLATDDIIGNFVKQYEFEAKAGAKVIDTFYSMQKYIPNTDGGHSMISLSVLGCSDDMDMKSTKFNPVNTYIRLLRDKYWSLLFQSKEMSRLLTQTARDRYLYKIREFRDYDFTFSNIKQLQIELVSHLSTNIDDAILEQFDNFTYKNSMDNASNVHYFTGWKTNDAFMINSKVIVPMWGVYGNRYGSGWSLYKARDFFEELEKIFVYLDGGKTEGADISSILHGYNYSNKYNGEKIQSKYFDVEFKKKGTAHIWFTNAELLKKFNIFGCQKHGWLPNSYGRKRYKDMSKEEQEVIKSFEGEKSYEKTVENPQYYLSGNQMLQIGMSEQ